MKTILYDPLHEVDSVAVPAVGLEFKMNEQKVVTDEQAELLLSNADFKDVSPAPKGAKPDPAPVAPATADADKGAA